MPPLILSTYELGHQPHLAALVAGVLRDGHVDYEVLDLSVDPDLKAFNRYILENDLRQPRIFIDTAVFTVGMLTSAMLFRDVLVHLEKHLGEVKTLIIYGLYAHEVAVEASKISYGNLIVRATPTMKEIAEDLGVQNVTTTKKYSPAREKLPPLTRYKTVITKGVEKVTGYSETSTGCRHRCLHCPLPIYFNGRVAVNPIEEILSDIETQVLQGATHITLGDPDFFNAPIHAMKVAKAIKTRFSDLSFDCTIKIEHLLKHRAYLSELGETGCSYITSAVESLSDEILINLAKGHKSSDVDIALEMVDNAGIDFHPSFVPFTPWTTLEDFEEILIFAYRNSMERTLEPVQLAIKLLVPSNSLLLKSPEFLKFKTSYDIETFSYLWTYRDHRVDKLQKAVEAEVTKGQLYGDPFEDTFFAIWSITEEYLGRSITVPERNQRRAQSVKSSEAWFCCAEPTSSQRLIGQ